MRPVIRVTFHNIIFGVVEGDMAPSKNLFRDRVLVGLAYINREWYDYETFLEFIYDFDDIILDEKFVVCFKNSSDNWEKSVYTEINQIPRSTAKDTFSSSKSMLGIFFPDRKISCMKPSSQAGLFMFLYVTNEIFY